MSAMNLGSGKIKWALFICVLLAVIAALWKVGEYANNSSTKSSILQAHSISGPDKQTGDQISKAKSSEASDKSAMRTAAEKTPPTIPVTKSLSWMQNMMELLQQAPRADNVATRSFAVYMPSALCTSLLNARNIGISSLEADIPAKRIPPDQQGLDRVAKRCSEYSGLGVDKLRGPVLTELKTENAPLTAFFAASNGAPEKARAQLARVLEDQDATALQPLGMVWPLLNTERLAATLPDDLKPYAQGISTAAFDIALCRAGAYCGTDSIALDMVCAKFGECNATDVENAYRRLHSTTGISFAETSRMADWIRNAIQRRDIDALWPNTAGFPSTRK
jgi:hypothetical protein